ncbi:MAG: hypothetical protein QXG05_04960 [Nitrososphaerota archaeon]
MTYRNTIRLKIYTIECISCMPLFENTLKKHAGINNVEALPMNNEIIITYNPSFVTEKQIKDRILEVAAKAGLNGKIAFINTQ